MGFIWTRHPKWELYVYDKDGHQLGEMQPSGVMIGSEVYAGSRHLATYNSVPYQTVFIHADWQGTERARTLYDGSGYQNCVNLPYGDGQICNTAPSDPSPLHYTGKMRDTETGLDYFGARYYGSSQGHWMSPDWADKPTAVPYANFGNPQSLNLYAMVAGNPVSKQDSDGHMFTLSEIEYGDGKNGPTTVFTGDGQDSGNMGGMRYVPGYVNVVFPDGTRSSPQRDVAKGLAAQVPAAVRAAMMQSAKASDAPTSDDRTGGFHEEGGLGGPSSSGALVISPDLPGPYSNPDIHGEVVTSHEPADPALRNTMADILYDWHAHPSGSTATHTWHQFASDADRQAAGNTPNAMHMVLGPRDKTVYFYDSGKMDYRISFKNFLSAK